MSSVALSVVVAAVLTALSAVVAQARSFAVRGLAAVPVLVLVGYALWHGILVPSDWRELPAGSGLLPSLLAWLAWALMAGALMRIDGVALPGRWGPLLAGAACGELGGSVLAVAGVTDDKVRARRVLAACAGALVSRAADPVALSLSSAPRSLGVWALSAGGALLVGAALSGLPAGQEASEERGQGLSTLWVPAAAVAVATVLPGLAPVALLAGAIGVALSSGRGVDGRPLVQVVVVGLGLLVAVAAGVPEVVAESLVAMQVPLEGREWVVLAASGAGLGLLFDGAAGPAAFAVLERAWGFRLPYASVWLGVPAMVAGLSPLVLTGTVRAGLARHLAWVVVSTLWVVAIAAVTVG